MEQNSASFLKQQKTNILTLGFIYALCYAGRYNFTTVHQTMSKSLGWTYKDFGIIASIALLVYGIAVFLNGPITDRIGGKRALMLGIKGSIVANILFGLSYFLIQNEAIWAGKEVVAVGPVIALGLNSSFVLSYLVVAWAFNYYSQAFSATSIVSINAQWYTPDKRAKLAGVFGALINVGRVITYISCPLIIRFLPWYWAFWIPAILLFIAYFFIDKLVVERPKPRTKRARIKHRSLLSPLVKSCLFMVLFYGITKNALDQWSTRFFATQFDKTTEQLSTFLPYLLFSIFGPIALILSNLVLVPLSDSKYFKGNRFKLLIMCGGMLTALLVGFSFFTTNPFVSAVFLVLIFFSSQAIHATIMGVLTADIAEGEAAGTLGGMFDGTCYIGGFIGTNILSYVLDKMKPFGNEWKYWPLVAASAAAVCCIFICISMRLSKNSLKLVGNS
jgi:OPA family glycerol-3-phosphate transporter-like MFS transporter